MKYISILMFLALFSGACGQDALDLKSISHRPPTVAGSFYPSDSNELKQEIKEYLNMEDSKKIEKDLIGIVVPHAGYVFSGAIAGIVYRELVGRKYDAVIIIAPSHAKSFDGSSVFKGDAYVTPLGVAKVDRELAKAISDNDGINYSYDGHEWEGKRTEHSLEVQIPFLQTVLPNTPIVPIVMGNQDNESINDLFKGIVKVIRESNKKVLIVASTDLSHFHNIKEANSLDSQVVNAFNRYDYFMMSYFFSVRKWEACGGGPMIVAMMAAEQLGANKSVTLEYATSADSPYGKGNEDRVVGYMAGAMIKDDSYPLDKLPDFNEENKKSIINAAKKGIEAAVLNKIESYHQLEDAFDLPEMYSSFVTIEKNEELRACMGHTFPSAPLNEEVFEVAKMASTSDYRFGPIRKDELDKIEFEVTIMSRMRRILDTEELQPGKDGLYIKLGRYAGLLLPQVAAERNWDRKTFLENICRKAGLSSNDYLNPDAELYVFKAIIIHE